MRRWSAIVFCCWLSAMIWLGPAGLSRAVSEEFKVIVHPSNPVAALGRDFLRDAYLKHITSWKHGEPLRPIELSWRFPVRERFSERVLRKTAAQMRSYWIQSIFSGKGVPPPEADGVDTVIAFVLSQPGAVGYLPVDANPGRAKVVRVE